MAGLGNPLNLFRRVSLNNEEKLSDKDIFTQVSGLIRGYTTFDFTSEKFILGNILQGFEKFDTTKWEPERATLYNQRYEAVLEKMKTHKPDFDIHTRELQWIPLAVVIEQDVQGRIEKAHQREPQEEFERKRTAAVTEARVAIAMEPKTTLHV